MWLAIEMCLSEMKVVITKPEAIRNSMHLLKAINSIAGLLPASFLYENRK